MVFLADTYALGVSVQSSSGVLQCIKRSLTFMHGDSLMSNRLIMRSKQHTNSFVPQKMVRAGVWLFIILLVGLRLLNGHIF